MLQGDERADHPPARPLGGARVGRARHPLLRAGEAGGRGPGDPAGPDGVQEARVRRLRRGPRGPELRGPADVPAHVPGEREPALPPLHRGGGRRAPPRCTRASRSGCSRTASAVAICCRSSESLRPPGSAAEGRTAASAGTGRRAAGDGHGARRPAAAARLSRPARGSRPNSDGAARRFPDRGDHRGHRTGRSTPEGGREAGPRSPARSRRAGAPDLRRRGLLGRARVRRHPRRPEASRRTTGHPGGRERSRGGRSSQGRPSQGPGRAPVPRRAGGRSDRGGPRRPST